MKILAKGSLVAGGLLLGSSAHAIMTNTVNITLHCPNVIEAATDHTPRSGPLSILEVEHIRPTPAGRCTPASFRVSNNRIKVIKRTAYGFRDDEYFFLTFPG